jgi:hypothetical protein
MTVVPLPDRTPGRAVRIATMHTLPAWIASHPDVDMPESVRAVRTITHAEQLDVHRRVAAVEAFAATHQLAIGEDPLFVFAALPLGWPEAHGVLVEYVLRTPKCDPHLLRHGHTTSVLRPTRRL